MKAILSLGNVNWEPELAAAFSHPSSKIRISRRCVDGVDALSAVQVHQIDLVIVGDASLRFDSSVLAKLSEQAVEVVAITTTPELWLNAGLTKFIALDLRNLSSVPQQILGALSESRSTPEEYVPTRKMFCVASFGGGVGRSFIARELALAISKLAGSVALVEADNYGPSLIQDLNLPSTTKDLLDVTQSSLGSTAEGWTIPPLAIVEPNLAVIPGLTDVSDWVQLRSPQLEKLWQALRHEYTVLVDVGPVFTSLEADSYPGFNHRDLPIQTVLAGSKNLIFCASANNVSVSRLIGGLIEHESNLRNYEISVVLNRCRSDKVANDFSALVQRHTRVSNIVTLVDDPDAVTSSELTCDFFGKHLPKHPITRKLESFAQKISTNQLVTNPNFASRVIHQLDAA
ncbi:MAG: tyrosine-protein kinase family protein [Actinobacteria bacterium]|nr:tyrosine-protein kinase family protein [Actinomycetota bacterium]